MLFLYSDMKNSPPVLLHPSLASSFDNEEPMNHGYIDYVGSPINFWLNGWEEKVCVSSTGFENYYLSFFVKIN